MTEPAQLAGKFLDVPKTNGLWLLLTAILITAVALLLRRANIRHGKSPWAFGRLWGAVPFIPVFIIGGLVILVVGH